MDKVKFLSLKDIGKSDLYPFTERAMRWHVWNSQKNGLKKAIFKIGKKLIIREDLFVEWLNSHAETKGEKDGDE